MLLPIALIMRFFGYDPLKKRKNNDNTYREDKRNYVNDLNRIF